MYCIECEHAVTELVESWGYHFTDMSVPDWDICFGPFTFSAPPEIEDGWNDNLTEPDPDELIQMDKAAESLALELAS